MFVRSSSDGLGTDSRHRDRVLASANGLGPIPYRIPTVVWPGAIDSLGRVLGVSIPPPIPRLCCPAELDEGRGQGTAIPGQAPRKGAGCLLRAVGRSRHNRPNGISHLPWPAPGYLIASTAISYALVLLGSALVAMALIVGAAAAAILGWGCGGFLADRTSINP